MAEAAPVSNAKALMHEKANPARGLKGDKQRAAIRYHLFVGMPLPSSQRALGLVREGTRVWRRIREDPAQGLQ